MRKLLLLLLTIAGSAWSQCSSLGYAGQQAITINSGQITGTLTNYAMLVLNPSTGLKTTGNGGKVTSSTGDDIIFVNGSGTALAFELVGHGQSYTTYNPANGNAEFHVLIPSATVGTVSYMCYGKSGATYSGAPATVFAAYKGVWHMTDATDTVNAAGGTAMTATGSPTSATGQINGALGVNGSTQGFHNTASLLTNGVDPFTVEAWAYTTDTSVYGTVFSSGDGTTTRIWFRQDGAGAGWAFYVKDALNAYKAATYSTISTNTWTHLVGVFDNTNIYLYVNGTLQSTTSIGAGSAAAGNLNFIGYDAADGSVDTYLPGRLDEVRVLNTNLNADQISADYKNQSAPGSFYTVGADTLGGSSFTIAPTAIPNNHAGSIQLSLTGSSTTWGSTTRFTLSGAGATGVTCVTGCSNSPTVTDGTHVKVVITTGSSTGTLTLTESVTGSNVSSTTVSVPTLSISPTSGPITTTPTLTLTGTNTVWSQETAAGLFTVTGGTGASIGTPTITTNVAGTVTLTVGSAAGTLTITDTSTGKTVSFTATAGTFTASPLALPISNAANIVVTLTGTGTSWVNASTVITATGVTGVSCGSAVVTSSTAATVICTTGSTPGTLTLTESVTGAATRTLAVGAIGVGGIFASIGVQ